LGAGDVYLAGGTLVCAADTALSLSGAYTQLAGTTLTLNLGSGGAGRVTSTGAVTLAGGTLNIRFKPGFAPTVGDTLNVISGSAVHGQFTAITVDGFKVTPTYTATGVLLRIDA
jgi:hypothetical protein